jgi:hypothetical protein
MGELCADSLLTESNMSELICMRLMGEAVPNGAAGYLGACYKRCQTREASATSDLLAAQLGQCRKQFVSFVSSALREPDTFEDNSVSSRADLLLFISTDLSSSSTLLLKEVVEDLQKENSFDVVTEDLLILCYNGLETGIPSEKRSLNDDYQSPLTALLTLAKADKKIAHVLALCSKFALEERLVTAKPAQNVWPVPRVFETFGVQATAQEHQTLLGRVLRICASPQDPKMYAIFKDAFKTNPKIIDGNIKQLRSKVQSVQHQAHELVLLLLKAGKDSKEAVLRWLTQALVLNNEATKSRPNPLIGASQGFQVNLCALFLRLCRPFLSDSGKLAKVDWSFIESKDALDFISADATKLLPPDQRSEEMDVDTVTRKEGGFNFITQSFFMCARALNEGVAIQLARYKYIMQSLNRHYDGLQNDEPNAVGTLVQKLITDVALLDAELLGDVVVFCSATAKSLVEKLSGGANQQLSSSGGWIVPKSSMPAEQLAFLASLPEFLVSDIVEMLLSIAKIAPSHLTKSPLDHVLELVMFFLRRPWATHAHVRTEIGALIHYVFLPAACFGKGERRWSGEFPSDGPQTHLLSNHPSAQMNLAPALLLLYGDVERGAGYYEKMEYRRYIMMVLKHLWALPTHRSAFRGIAQHRSEEEESNYFVRFANGLMNETNALVAETIDLLAEIKNTQVYTYTLSYLRSISPFYLSSLNLSFSRHSSSSLYIDTYG